MFITLDMVGVKCLWFHPCQELCGEILCMKNMGYKSDLIIVQINDVINKCGIPLKMHNYVSC